MNYIGTKLRGFCNGYFGRDDYEEKIIEGQGKDWIVVRDIRGNIKLATFTGLTQMNEMVLQWIDE